MRIALIVLILANVAFFGWAHWVDVPAEAKVAPASPLTEPLLQLAPEALTAVAVRCRTIGPFTELSTVSAAVTTLRNRGVQPHDRVEQTQAADGYWVYLSGIKDAGDAKKAVAKLAAAGLRDLTAAEQPDDAGRLSVGMFSDQAHAVARAEQIRKLGLTPMLELHQRSVDQHWLDVNLRSGDADPSLTGIAADNNAAAPAIADCPAKNGSG